jgi:hypothetical protein
MSTSTEQVKDRPPTPPSHRHQKMPVVVLLSVVPVIVVLIGGSLFWLWRGNSARSGNSVQTGPTATATALPTPITPPVGSFFYDTFENNNHGWDLSSDSTSGYYRILVNHTLILATTDANTTLIESVPTSSINLSDYVVSTDFTINQGSADDNIGLYVRGDSNLDHDYRVDINGNNTFDVAKEWLASSGSEVREETTYLVEARSSSLLRPLGQKNTLMVILIGSTLVVELNNIVVSQVSDTSYTSGQIALFAHDGGDNSGVTVSFTRVEVDHLAWPVEEPVGTPTPPVVRGTGWGGGLF